MPNTTEQFFPPLGSLESQEQHSQVELKQQRHTGTSLKRLSEQTPKQKSNESTSNPITKSTNEDPATKPTPESLPSVTPMTVRRSRIRHGSRRWARMPRRSR